jgi:hypothetical protein
MMLIAAFSTEHGRVRVKPKNIFCRERLGRPAIAFSSEVDTGSREENA